MIVHAYEAWGDDAFARFNGQFAVALWDARAATLVLARDRLGVRPLYLCEHDGPALVRERGQGDLRGDPSDPARASIPSGSTRRSRSGRSVPPRTRVRGRRRSSSPGTSGPTRAQGSAPSARSGTPRYPEPHDDAEFRGSLDEAVEARARRARGGDAPAHAARRRAGRQLPLGRARQLARRGARACARRASGSRTFSLRFEDAEYDETAFQRAMASDSGATITRSSCRARDIAAAFPDVDLRTPSGRILRTAPAPLFLLSRLVRDAGIKVVLTGEGADEMFAGYDLFREGKVRRFWARQPASQAAGRGCSSGSIRISRARRSRSARWRAQFFGRGPGAPARRPASRHEPRWQHDGGAEAAVRAGPARAGDGAATWRAICSARCRRSSRGWSPLAQDQYLEIRTLLSGYLLSSQGDRMLMAHSVEGRFPFLDADVVDARGLAARLRYKLRVLDEKHVLKRAAAGLVPRRDSRARRSSPIARRTRCPSSGPTRRSGSATSARARPPWRAGCFDPRAVAQLWRKCRARAATRAVLERGQHGARRRALHAAPPRIADPVYAVGRGWTALVQNGGRSGRCTGAGEVTMRVLVDQLLAESARERGDAIALIDAKRAVTYRELNALANQFANLFVNAGVRCGDRVVLALDNSIEFAAVYFGAMKAAGVAVPLPPGPEERPLDGGDCRLPAGRMRD